MNTQGTFLVHAEGGWEATLDDLKRVEVPEATYSYEPLPHTKFVEIVKERLPRFGLTQTKERYALSKDGAKMFGVLNCSNGSNAEDWGIAIGLRNSYDKTMVAGLVAGSNVFVCDNLAFSGEVKIGRKHTGYILSDLPHLVHQMLFRVKPMTQRVRLEVNTMKACEINDKIAHHLLILAMKRKIFPVSRLPKVEAEWSKPTHDDFKPRTAWSLFNAFTANERRAGQPLFQRTMQLTELFNKELSLIAA